MEKPSRSHHRRHSSSASFSNKLSAVYSFASKSVYDDVFAGPPKFGAPTFSSRVEDYNEIFNSSKAWRASSIPVLDLSSFRETETPARVRSSDIDYSKIFGGFSDADFAAPVEELFAGPKVAETSSGEAWTPAETEFFSKDSETSNCLEETKVFSDAASHQSFSSKKQFNMSYHKTNQRSRDGTNGTTHIAQLHVVPGFTCVIDEKKTEDDKPLPSKASDAALNMDFSQGKTEGKCCEEAKSHVPTHASKKSTSEADMKSQTKSIRNGLHSKNIKVHEMCLKRHPLEVPSLSNMPPSLGNNKGGSKRSNSKASKNDISEGIMGSCSPTFSDEEVDKNSAAAASAAAVKKAIMEAQARMRIVKESMKRKNGLETSVKLGSNNGLKLEKKIEGKNAETYTFNDRKACETREGVDIARQIFAGTEGQDVNPTGRVDPDSRDSKNVFIAKEFSGRMQGKEYRSISVDERSGVAEECEVEKQVHELTNTGKQQAAIWVSEEENSKKKMLQSVDGYEWMDKVTDVKSFQQSVENGEKLKPSAETSEQEVTEMKLHAHQKEPEWDEHQHVKNLHTAHENIENSQKLRVSREQEEPEKELRASHEGEKCENDLKKPYGVIEEVEMFKVQDKIRLQEAWEHIKNGNKPEVPQEQEQNERGVRDISEQAELEDELKEIYESKKEKKKLNEVHLLRDECHDILREEACGREENDKESYTCEENDGKNLDDVCEQYVDENKMNNVYYREENEKGLEVVCEWESNAKLKGPQKQEENEKIIEAASGMEENNKWSKEETHECEEIYEIHRETCHREDEKTTDTSQKTFMHEEKMLWADNDAWEQVETEVSCSDYANGEEDGIEVLCSDYANDNDAAVICETIALEEIGKIAEITKTSCELKNEEDLEVFKLANILHEREMFAKADMAQGASEYNEINDNMNGASEALFSDGEALGDNEKFVEQFDWSKNLPKSVYDLRHHVEKLGHELGNDIEHVNEAEVSLDVDKSNIREADEEQIKNGKIMDGTQLPHTLSGRREAMEEDESAKKHNETLTVEEGEAEENLQNGDLEEQHIRKVDEVKMREKEKKRERIAVERAIREARERAFAEARERAERAAVERVTAEARQRVMAEAQERFDKASAEAKSLAEKASLKAKLKAERAAVERATAEARERALQKAMSGKATFETREREDRFATEKYSSASRDNGMKQSFSSSDPECQGSDPSSTTKYSNSTSYGEVPNATERFDGAKGEPAQRCQAKLERHQRTVERAAKALAEKNMRDLLAQKEQAEKNRLAEALDADIKRWSSGKQGNLRALLSTLQYILAPDSGWQPISLTDIITSIAVKKAYRKAALCVHPDKLQQRGASIPQKYICEKVFDLLKDAWNKFNSEER